MLKGWGGTCENLAKYFLYTGFVAASIPPKGGTTDTLLFPPEQPNEIAVLDRIGGYRISRSS